MVHAPGLHVVSEVPMAESEGTLLAFCTLRVLATPVRGVLAHGTADRENAQLLPQAER